MRLFESEDRPAGRVEFQGISVTIEYPVGSVKIGKNRDGETWTRKYHDHYGRIDGVLGGDGEELDCFVCPEPDLDASAYIVVQLTPDGTAFDEEKVMLGYPSEEEAREAYVRHCHNPGEMFGGIEEVTMDELRDRMEDGKIVAVDRETGRLIESFDDWDGLARWRAGLAPIVSEMYAGRVRVGGRIINEDLEASDLWNILVPLISFDEYVPKEDGDNVVVAVFVKEVPEAVEPLRRAIEMCPGVISADSGDSSTVERTSIVYAEFRRADFDFEQLEHLVDLLSKLAEISPEEFTVKLPGLDRAFEFNEKTIMGYLEVAAKVAAENEQALEVKDVG